MSNIYTSSIFITTLICLQKYDFKFFFSLADLFLRVCQDLFLQNGAQFLWQHDVALDLEFTGEEG